MILMYFHLVVHLYQSEILKEITGLKFNDVYEQAIDAEIEEMKLENK